jgi:ATP-dependent RNA helicase DeaD
MSFTEQTETMNSEAPEMTLPAGPALEDSILGGSTLVESSTCDAPSSEAMDSIHCDASVRVEFSTTANSEESMTEETLNHGAQNSGAAFDPSQFDPSQEEMTMENLPEEEMLNDEITDDADGISDEEYEEQEPAEVVAETVTNGFRKLGLAEPLFRAIEDAGYTNPTPIQEQTITLLLQGRDVVGQAQTGSGKTAAFALPVLQRVDTRLNQPQVLVLVPTRELAIQVAAAFDKYASRMDHLRTLAIYGGAAYQPQFSQLKRGVHVVVGTPGRVMDHMNRGSLDLKNLKCLVLDEADEMLRMGFAESVEWVLTQIPTERQIALFSATMPGPIRHIAQQHLRNPAEITIKQKAATADTIRQRYLVVGQFQKDLVLARVLEAEQIDAAIVFVKLKSSTEPLCDTLNARGFKAAALNGDIAQAQRERIIEHLKSGKLDIVVATDVAARGLDVQRISHVINYDLPGDSEAYVHRIGRTGRAGRNGAAILFVHPKAQRMLKNLEYATRQKIEPMDLPTNRQINKIRVSRFHQRVLESMEHPMADAMGSIIEQLRRENPETPIEKIVAGLAVMANDGNPLLLREEVRQEEFYEPRRKDDRFGRGPRDGRFEQRGRYGDSGGRGRDDRGYGGRDSAEQYQSGSRRREPGDRGFAEAPAGAPGNGSAPPFGERRERTAFEGSDRGFRDDRGPRPERRRGRPGDEGMETFRIEVGHNHQVKPGNIVGAIANEAGIDSAKIGRIEIYDDFSTVDLPQGMPQEVFFALQKVWVSGRQLKIAKDDGAPRGASFRGGPSEGRGRGEGRGPGEGRDFRDRAPRGPRNFDRGSRPDRPDAGRFERPAGDSGPGRRPGGPRPGKRRHS